MANGKKQEKKPTAAQMERRLNNAILHIDRTKDVKSIFFSDKGLRLTVDPTEGYAIIATMYHRHVYDATTMSGISRPFLYISRLIDIALSNDCEIRDEKGNATGYSFAKLLETLKAKEDQTEYNIATYISWWLHNLFVPVYQISEEAATQFLCWFNYLHNIACQSVFLGEHKDGLTNKQFVEEHDKLMKEMLEGIEEHQIFEPLSDEQRTQQEIEALQEQNLEQNTEAN